MPPAKRVALHVSNASAKAVRAYAKESGYNVGDAADALIATAVSRRAALAKYGKKQSRKGKK